MNRGDGDGWVELADGTRRWGLFGASGLLLHAADTAGIGHVLLQHRVWWSHMGGTWGVPGGARDSGESPLEAALREFGEEVAGPLDGVLPSAVHRQDHAVWTYDTVFARLPEPRPFTPGSTESAEIRWVPVDRVPELALLPAFEATWPQLLTALDRSLLLVVDVRGDARDPAALRDALAETARTGIASALLPQVPALTALHWWFPRVRLLVSGPGPAPAPGVEVATAAEHDGTPGPDRTTELILTDDPGLRAARTSLGAVGAPAGLLDALLSDDAVRRR